MQALGFSPFLQYGISSGQGVTSSSPAFSSGVTGSPGFFPAQPAFAQSVSPQSSPMVGMMMIMMQMMMQVLQMMMGQQAQSTSQTTPSSTPGSTATTGVTTGSDSSAGTGSSTSTTDSDSSTGTGPKLSQNDMLNYILGQSHGGTTAAGIDTGIFGKYMQQDSRFANAGSNEFDAATAKAYAAQFKGYAMGLDVRYEPGEDMHAIAANLMKGQSAKMTDEAETIANVAALYRGDFGNAGAYNNPALKDLLIQWGRSDIANQDGVGQFDIQSVGGVVKALNEQKDPAVRKAWLQQIFDFENNTANSPSGAVPKSGYKGYQDAINMYRNGVEDKLLDNYNKDVKTSDKVDPSKPGGGISTSDTDKNIDFTKLSTDEREELGLSDRDRAILHMWGRQVITKGVNDGSIYNNFYDAKTGEAKNFGTPEEQKFIKEMRDKEIAKYGHVNGKELDKEFFGLMQRINPDVKPADVQKYLDAPEHISDGKPLDITSNVDTLQKRTGLNATEQAALRLWGHEPLFNGGKIDGSILAYTIGNDNALDSANKGGEGAGIDNIAKALLKADLTSDGVRDGDSLKFAFGQTLDKIYLGGDGVTVGEVKQHAQQVAKTNGRTAEQIQKDVQSGVVKAMSDATKMFKDHPIISTAAVGSIAAATAVCPFLGAMGAGAAGIMAGQKMMNQ